MKYRNLIVLSVILIVFLYAGSNIIFSSGTKFTNSDPHGHDHGHGHGDHGEGKSSQITLWDERFEIFLEHPYIVANTPVQFVTHVTDRAALEPRRRGPVIFKLTDSAGKSTRFEEKIPARDGIYIPALNFPRPGSWKISLIIPVDGQEYVVQLPAVTVYKTQADADRAPDPEEVDGISFLKEQQWKLPFSVKEVKSGKTTGSDSIIIPDSAIIDENGKQVAFVQLAGETFEKRYLNVTNAEQGFVQVLSGLSKGEHVVVKGAVAFADAEHKIQDSHGHEEHAHEEDGHKSIIEMSETEMKRFGIEVNRAGSGVFDISIKVAGEIGINTDRMVHIVPRVTGIVREVKKKLGDPVNKGEIMAVIESRDLADAKAKYLASVARFKLTNTVLIREEKLWKDKVSSEQEYLDAKIAFEEAKIEMHSAEQKLLALDFNKEYLKKLPSEPGERLTLFEIKAPFNGTLIQKNITLGEVVNDDADAFVIADLDTVWADLRVHQKDIGLVNMGQEVIISATSSVPETKGVIDYVEPIIDKKTRTALARVVLNNDSRQLRPGTFISADILVEKSGSDLVVAKSILQDVNDKTCVFVKNDHGFELRPVTIGRANGTYIEILAGLTPGELVVTRNSFRLKAELEKDAGGDHGGHGHAH